MGNKYEIVKQLGKGFFGELFLAQKANEKYMIESFPTSLLSNDEFDRYKQLINTLTNIDNEYIIKYYDIYKENDHYNVVMEFGEESNLKNLLKN